MLHRRAASASCVWGRKTLRHAERVGVRPLSGEVERHDRGRGRKPDEMGGLRGGERGRGSGGLGLRFQAYAASLHLPLGGGEWGRQGAPGYGDKKRRNPAEAQLLIVSSPQFGGGSTAEV